MKILLESTVGGKELEKIYDEIYALLNCIAQVNPSQNGDISRGTMKNLAKMIKFDSVTALTTQLSTSQNQMIRQFSKLGVNESQAQVNVFKQTPCW